MILKEVIRYTNANALEATWVTREQLPDVHVPESFGPTARDEDGNTVPGELIPAHIVPGGIKETVVKCQAYANNQMAELAADLGPDAPAYQALMDEIAATYVPPPPPTQDELLASYQQALDELFNSTAQARRYDSRVTCALRAGYPGPFQAEGLAFAQWMDACNALGYQLMAEVLGGQRPMPTVPEFLALLPPMEWPA